MSSTTVLWSSPRNIWQVARAGQRDEPTAYLYVDNAVTGLRDYPVLQNDGRVAYDWPERIPTYVKQAVAAILHNGHLVLVQTFEKPQFGYFDDGPKCTFSWRVDRMKGAGCVGSWQANTYFSVAPGATEKQTLGNARRSLAARARQEGQRCTFHYEVQV